ncbi:MAG: cation-translocating P-type ATPase [Planctomycetota bacterium]|nr:cation-translocating P-type ATPase [Planctomycetota bacterium]
MKTWHRLESPEVLNRLRADATLGLTTQEAASRLAEHGPNELIERARRGAFGILWEQLTATMVVILLFAAALSGALGAWKDTIAIAVIVALFVVIGLVQEVRAERAIAALKRLAVPVVKVRRDGRLQEVSAGKLVPGDILVLETGNYVSADCRILESVNLQTQESALTGESEPIEKHSKALDTDDPPLGDRRNMTYMGTVVSFGRGLGAVVATGMKTELGKIADMIQKVKQEQTPLQRRLDRVGRVLAYIGFAVAGLVAALGLLQGEKLTNMLLTAVSVAVAVVPEGLPAVVTITLALGAQRMLKRKSLIRKLPAVETLGSVTVICSDKTGTLTENRMKVIMLDVAGHEVKLADLPERSAVSPDKEEASLASAPIPLLLTGGALCNDAHVAGDPDGRNFQALGDPTEVALLLAAGRIGYSKGELEKVLPRVWERPFDSQRKRMTTVHECLKPGFTPNTASGLESGMEPYVAFTKGSVDGLLDVSNRVWNNGQADRLTADWRERIHNAHVALAMKAMRVLGVAFKPLGSVPSTAEADAVERDLILVGLVGMIDPPRHEVKGSVQACRMAGIRPVMITGDHPLTGLQIARELGIAEGDAVLTGVELERMSVEDLKEHVDRIPVFARVSPEHKLKIVQAFQEKGHIVAMTGDGVNDAPALKKADIGVAMGLTGTDVARQASDMILLDDNFATIVAAVEEGRVIYDNVRKFIKFSVAGNLGKVTVMLLAPLLGNPLPLSPLQLLWLNILTDGLLGLGLGVERAEPDTLRRPPYSPAENVFTRSAGIHVGWVGALIGLLALGVGVWYSRMGRDSWQTMVMTTLAFSQVFQALASRSRHNVFPFGLLSNPLLLAMVLLTVALQTSVIYVPVLQTFLKAVPLTVADFGICVGLSSLVLVGIEIEKWLARRRK